MDKINALRELAANITSSYGGGSLIRLGDSQEVIDNNMSRQSFGFKMMDLKSGGGLCGGQIHEIFGAEGDGKTSLALNIAAEVQKNGGIVYFVDAEHKLNLEYAKKLGVNVKDLLLTQPSHGEQALDIMKNTFQSGLVDLCIVDSVASLVPLAELEGEFTDANIGAHARLMSKMCRVLTPIIKEHNIILILINQTRHKIGIMFGSPETTTGGLAIKFYSIMRMKVTSSKDDDKGTRRFVNVNFVKQQAGGLPYDKVQLSLILGEGFNKGLDLIEYGLEKGILKLNGSFVKFGNINLGNGKNNASQKILESDINKEFMKEVKKVEKNKKAIS